jgi:phosphosulfolactate synthase
MEQNLVKRAFKNIKIHSRPLKPRETGITMLCDLGYGVHEQRDILDLAAPFIDIAKIATGIAGTISEENTRKKISTYREYQVESFLGGMFLEYAIFHQGMDIAKYYFEEHQRLGLKLIEISDNNLDIKPEDKFNLIRTANEEFGLRVLGEVGTKSEVTTVHGLVEDIKVCLSAGSWKVFVEAAELTDKSDGSILTDIIEGIQKEVGINDIIFELSGPWISNFHHFQNYILMNFLIDTFGPEVNIANVKSEILLPLEMLRNGLDRKIK